MSQKNNRQGIKVVVRVRPILRNLKEWNTDSVIRIYPNEGSAVIESAEIKKTQFRYDYAFSPESTQQEIYEITSKEIIKSVLDGYNGTIFAYGQTGSGKTFTMYGKGDKGQTAGIVPRAVNDIFHDISIRQASNANTKIFVNCSYIQIYKEKILDLLVDPKEKNPPKVNLREDTQTKSFELEHNIVVPINSFEEMNEKVLKVGKVNKKVRKTQMNEESSRAHTILGITIDSITNVDGQPIKHSGKLNLVDLAGSESSDKAETVDEALKEGASINTALMILGNCISCLTGKNKVQVIPFRESPLTKILKDSLGGNAKTLMIAAVSPSEFNASESLNTLKYAQKAKKIKNKAIINMDPKDALILSLKNEIIDLQKLLNSGVPLREENISTYELTEIESRHNKEVKDIKSEIGSIKEDTEEIYSIIQLQKEQLEFDKKLHEQISQKLNELKSLYKIKKQKEEEDKYYNDPVKSAKEIILLEEKSFFQSELEKTKEMYGSADYSINKLVEIVKDRISIKKLHSIYENSEYDEEIQQWHVINLEDGDDEKNKRPKTSICNSKLKKNTIRSINTPPIPKDRKNTIVENPYLYLSYHQDENDDTKPNESLTYEFDWSVFEKNDENKNENRVEIKNEIKKNVEIQDDWRCGKDITNETSTKIGVIAFSPGGSCDIFQGQKNNNNFSSFNIVKKINPISTDQNFETILKGIETDSHILDDL